MITLRPYQNEAIEYTFKYFKEYDGNPLIVLPTGCHAAGTKVLMFNGSEKSVEDVVIGDLLVGPDGTPRKVLNLARGQEMMWKITPKKGDPFIVNESHILSLKTTSEGKNYPCNTVNGVIENVTVKSWESKSKYWKHLRKLWYSEATFEKQDEPPIDPWVLGVLIGDGCIKYGVQFFSEDFEVIDEMTFKIKSIGADVKFYKKKNTDCMAVSCIGGKRGKPNVVTNILKKLDLHGKTSDNKFVPNIYKFGSKKVRLEILAGLLDTDGSLSGKNHFDFISKSETLAKDVLFIARSVGLWASLKETKKYCQTGGGGTYWRVNISGNTDIVPTRVKRKKAKPRAQKKNPLVTGFKAEPVGKGNFFGFELDKDHLYLTSDFMVHHNTGKSFVIAEFCRQVLTNWGDCKIVVVTHVRELIKQNYDELKRLWSEANAGINSAGLNQRDFEPSIVFSGIQSVHKHATKFTKVDLCLIDEAHLIPRKTNTMYQKFLKTLKVMNPHMRVIGLTATPYRLDSGLLCSGKDALFTDISYEASLADMVKQGYLTKLVSKEPKTRLDVTGVSTRGGEFVAGELERAVDKDDVNRAAVKEIVAFGQQRKSWLLFCAGVSHATHIAELVRSHGITCETIFGDTPKAERDRIVAEFKAGRIQALASMGVLTTGFNAPSVDLIALLRPTQSVGLYVQIMGRGMRNHDGKQDCLVLDFAGNVARHGPVDRINPKKPRRSDEAGEAPTKTCPECKSIVHAAAMECMDCGYIWPPREIKIDRTASTLPVMAAAIPEQWVKVNAVYYRRHEKPGSPDSMRVEYRSGLITYREWICFDHRGYPQERARKWWQRRMAGPGILPKSTAEAIAQSDSLLKPAEIKVRKNGKYTEITEFRFMPDLPSGRTGMDIRPSLSRAS